MFRDPTEEYFRRRHNHDLLGPYHAGLEPYHDLELTELGEDCAMPRSRLIESAWVPYTAIAIMFLVLAYSSVTSWTSSPAKVRLLLTYIQLLPGPAVQPRLGFSFLQFSYFLDQQSSQGKASLNLQFSYFLYQQSGQDKASLNLQFSYFLDQQSSQGKAPLNLQFSYFLDQQSSQGKAPLNLQFSYFLDQQSGQG